MLRKVSFSSYVHSSLGQGIPNYFQSQTLLPYPLLGPIFCCPSPTRSGKMPKYLVVKGEKVPALKIPLHTLIFTFYCKFKKQSSSGNIENIQTPYIQIFTLFRLLRNNFSENRKNLNRCLWRCKTWRRPKFLGNHNAFMLQMPLKIKQILIKAKNTFSEIFKWDPFSKSWKLRPFFFCNLAPISASHFYDSEICPKIQQWIAWEHYQCIKDFILINLLKIGKFW